MLIGYDRRDAERLVVITLAGNVTASEIGELIREQAENGTWSYGVLYDERKARVDLALGDMRRLAELAETYSATHGMRGRVAIVVDKEVEYGVNKIVSAFAERAGYRIAVVRTMEDALAHLQGRAREG